ncbi:MAG: sigma 54-interacting transcriptional regulator [Planctomycetes bacterium]|nr:sigma 54-interacting transcriptional regulator [Planctomycetota bacterium]
MGREPAFRHPRYETLRLLAEGGMGKVHLARDLLEGREVALKVYPARYNDERLRAEFLALKDLHHPGVARALHFGVSETDRAPFLTLERIRGQPIDRHLASIDPSLRARETARLFASTAAAVAYLHRRGVLHLDLKPDNILVVDAGPGAAPEPVLIDFGLVRASADAAGALGHATLPYAPPEVFQGEPPTPASDVYSLAAAFYRLFSGRYPVEGTSFGSFARAHASEAARPIPEAPQAIERLLLRALAKDPAQRFRDAGELHRALLAAVAAVAPAEDGRRQGPVAFHEPDFVGRTRELEAFARWVEGDRADRPAFEVCGGGGWGKSRFLEKVETLLEARGKKAFLVRPAEGDPLALLKTLEHIASVLGPRRAAARQRRDGLGPAPDEAARAAAREAAARVLPLLAEDAFLLVDDAHLASPLEDDALQGLLRALRDSGAAAGGGIVAARRRPEPSADAETPWQHAGLSTAVDLSPLELDEALRIDLEGLDGALSGCAPEKARALKARLHEQVGGHPLLYVRGLLDLAGDPEAATRLAPTDRLLAQLARLERRERDVALCLAALGRAAAPQEVAGILSMGSAEAAAAAGALRRLGLVAVRGEEARPAHESVTTAVLEGSGEAARRVVHGRVAAHLAAGGRSEGLIQAAWHLDAAGEPVRALELAERWLLGGSLEPGAPPQRAVEALERAAEAAGRTAPRGRALLEAASDVLESLGRFEECLRLRLEIVDAPGGGDPERAPDLVRRCRKLGTASHRAGRVDLALQHLERCVEPWAESAAPVESLRARSDIALLHHFRGEPDRAVEHARRGVEAWRESRAEARRATLQSAVNFHSVLGQVHLRRLEVEEATKVLETGVRLARKAGSPSNMALLLNNLALAYHFAGRLDAARATFGEAETIARSLGDPAALVSVRANVAQILARQGKLREARGILDEIEESPAVRQSKRLRLWCLYTRALLLQLLGAPCGEAWDDVARIAGEAGDPFLGKFAKAYRAEEHIREGEISTARRLLEAVDEPVLAAPRAARLSLIEALAGRPDRARELRKAADPDGAPPAILRAWSLYYAAASALETADLDEARGWLARSSRIFQTTGFAAGRIECALLAADLHLRARTPAKGARRELELAERSIQEARKVKVTAPAGAAPRSRDLRSALLEARLLLRRIAGEDLEGRAARKAAAALEPGRLRRSLEDLLARAAGDPDLAADPGARILVEIIASASLRLAGEPARAQERARNAATLHREAAAKLDAGDREGFLSRDPWERFGLASHRPLEGPWELDSTRAAALVAVLRAAAGPGSDAAGAAAAALADIGRATGASRVEVLIAGRVAAAWSAGPPVPEGPCRVLSAPLKHLGTPHGQLRAEIPPGSPALASDEALLEAAALALAPRFAAEAPGAAAAPPGAPAPAAVETVALGRATARLEGTSALRGRRIQAPRATATADVQRTFRAEGMVLAGAKLLQVARSALKVGPSEIPVLITGDSGTGKSLLARVLHCLSTRAAGPFVSQDAGAVPPELFEADFFGYERGAFTGAERTRTGFLFQAAGGTFHLEEVGDMSPSLQQSLLRVIEEREVRPLGSTSPRRLDVRFMASTQHDLEALVARGVFRRDLYYRLRGARIHIPPLREVSEVLPELAAHHWREITGSTARFPAAALEVLKAHDWPGNVRELISVLRRLAIESQGPPGAEAVRAAIGESAPRGPFSSDLFESRTFDEVSQALEAAYLGHLLEKHGGDLDAIAAALGKTTRSVYRRFERLGLRPKDLKG